MHPLLSHRNRAIALLLFLLAPAFVFSAGISRKPLFHAEFRVALTCTAENPEGSFITLINDQDSSQVQHGLTDESGYCLMINVPSGQYSIRINRLYYEEYYAQINISSNISLNVTLQQVKRKPIGVRVNKLDLKASWSRPSYDSTCFFEDWSSGSFATNGWTVTGGANWILTTGDGHPAPCAAFNWFPQVMNYGQQLTSRLIPAPLSPQLTFGFDFYLSGYACTTVQTLAVEIWDASKWVRLWYANTNNGNYPWTAVTLDISKYAGQNVRFRFNSTGEDSYDINYWFVDNIRIVGTSGSATGASCVSGYKVFLNNAQIGTTSDLMFQVPPSMVQYGQPAQLCVRAVYSNGESAPSCTNFTPEYLCPPRNLAGVFQQDTTGYRTHLSWEIPKKDDGTTPPGITGYRVYRDGAVIRLSLPPATLACEDANPYPDTCRYQVAALYDLTPYGFALQNGESLPCGPVPVYIHPGYDTILPFTELWSTGSLATNHWTQEPSAGRWAIDPASGHPAPCAAFAGQAADTNYANSLVSPWFDLTGWNCSKVMLDFYLSQPGPPNNSQTLSVEVNNNRQWIRVWSETGWSTTTWYRVIQEITFLQGSKFRLRFRISGTSPAPGTVMKLDDIRLYGICQPPKNSGYEKIAGGVTLHWNPPGCYTQVPTNWAFYTDETPESDRSGGPGVSEWYGNKFYLWLGYTHFVIREIGLYFTPGPDHGGDCLTLDIFDWKRNLVCTTDAFTPPDSGWIDLPVNSVMVTDSFYLMVHWNHTAHPTSRLGLDRDPNWGLHSAIHYDGSSWQWVTMPGSSQPSFMIRWKGIVPNYLQDAPNLSGVASGPGRMPESCCVGYDIYRSGEAGAIPYGKINTSVVTGLSYTDYLTGNHNYGYYITSVFMDSLTGQPFCTRAGDTMYVGYVVGQEETAGSLRIYPNPVRDDVVIESNRIIEEACLFDYLGRIIVSRYELNERKTHLPLAGLAPGVYILRVFTDSRTEIRKIVKE
jgi:hypothetical protein